MRFAVAALLVLVTAIGAIWWGTRVWIDQNSAPSPQSSAPPAADTERDQADRADRHPAAADPALQAVLATSTAPDFTARIAAWNNAQVLARRQAIGDPHDPLLSTQARKDLQSALNAHRDAQAAASLSAVADRLDHNGDGRIDQAEFAPVSELFAQRPFGSDYGQNWLRWRDLLGPDADPVMPGQAVLLQSRLFALYRSRDKWQQFDLADLRSGTRASQATPEPPVATSIEPADLLAQTLLRGQHALVLVEIIHAAYDRFALSGPDAQGRYTMVASGERVPSPLLAVRVRECLHGDLAVGTICEIALNAELNAPEGELRQDLVEELSSGSQLLCLLRPGDQDAITRAVPLIQELIDEGSVLGPLCRLNGGWRGILLFADERWLRAQDPATMTAALAEITEFATNIAEIDDAAVITYEIEEFLQTQGSKHFHQRLRDLRRVCQAVAAGRSLDTLLPDLHPDTHSLLRGLQQPSPSSP